MSVWVRWKNSHSLKIYCQLGVVAEASRPHFDASRALVYGHTGTHVKTMLALIAYLTVY